MRTRGLAGRFDLPQFRVYCSEHAHSSIDKAVILLGLGHDSLRRIEGDAEFRMRPDALAAALDEDARRGIRPLAVVATVGTTSTTSVDPRRRDRDHLCGAKASGCTSTPRTPASRRCFPASAWILRGAAAADSVVVNPHKWLFTPFDLSAFYCRRMDVVRAAFSLAPEYLKTAEASDVQNLMDTGIQLGRRFRALKLWMVLRHFGAEGLRARLGEHIRLARLFAAWVDGSADFERTAPAPFSVVCFRANRSPTSSTRNCWTASTPRARFSCRTPSSTGAIRFGSRSAICTPWNGTSSEPGPSFRNSQAS